MKHNKLIFVLICVFVLLLAGSLIAFNHQKPRMMVLHSYSEADRWEQSFNRGVRSILETVRVPLAQRWHYMTFVPFDNPSPTEWAASAQRARLVIDQWQPDVLLIVGEEAQDFVGRHYVNQDNIRIVYATAEHPQTYGYDTAQNVTGVRETLPLDAIKQLLQYAPKQPLKIRSIGIDNQTGRAEREQLLAYDWGAHTLLDVTLAQDRNEWEQAVHEAKDADILIVLSLSGLAEQKEGPAVVDPRKLGLWTQTHAKPLALGIRESFVIDGGAIAVVPSGEGLGQQTTAMATNMLLHPNSELSPVQNSEHFILALRPDKLAQKGIVLPSVYVQAARASHSLYTNP